MVVGVALHCVLGLLANCAGSYKKAVGPIQTRVHVMQMPFGERIERDVYLEAYQKETLAACARRLLPVLESLEAEASSVPTDSAVENEELYVMPEHLKKVEHSYDLLLHIDVGLDEDNLQ